MLFKKTLPLTLAIGALCSYLSNSYAVDWPVYAPHGLYVVGEAGLGYVAENTLRGLRPTTVHGTTYTEVRQKMSGSFSQHIAVGDYLSNPDSITAIGLELGFTHFNKVQSHVANAIAGTNTTASQTTTAWSTTVEGIASFNIISNSVALFTKLGLGYASIKRNIAVNGVSPRQTDNGDNSSLGIAGGLGLRFTLTKNIALRTEIDGFSGATHAGYAAALAGVEFNF